MNFCLFQKTSLKKNEHFLNKSFDCISLNCYSLNLYISTPQKTESLYRESVNLIGDLQDLTGQSPR